MRKNIVQEWGGTMVQSQVYILSDKSLKEVREPKTEWIKNEPNMMNLWLKYIWTRISICINAQIMQMQNLLPLH